MDFDVFHSVGRIDSVAPRLSDRDVFTLFFSQARAAETLGYGTLWVAESHFSSEVQKQNPDPVIPHYAGEVGLNADSMQTAHALFARTRRLGFGTAILNIVGGNGGPIAAADRVKSLAWHVSLMDEPRPLSIGVATGRFPYINRPFGVVPRSEEERILWPQYQQLVFVEALEIFLRLMNGETLSSEMVGRHRISAKLFRKPEDLETARSALGARGALLDGDGLEYKPRWQFEPLKIVPELGPEVWSKYLRFVLGSSDPLARDHGLKFADLDIFNLSFTPPAAIDKTHAEMFTRYRDAGRVWSRGRMPRTVLVFIDDDSRTAYARASRCFDTYMEAMRGTAQFPPKAELMARALIGSPDEIRAQLSPQDPHGFQAEDRLMLWFEFNQTDGAAIEAQMRSFAERVMPHYACEPA